MKGRQFIVLYFLSLFFIGLGYIAFLPPYEGIDEIAHYASIRQIADTGTLPVYGESFFPHDVAKYSGPLPYDSQKPPYTRGMTYAKFFAQPDLSNQYLQDYRAYHPHPPYVPDQNSPNWEAQHPPLYYGLMAVVMKATQGLSFVAETFWLRLVSYLLALGGVVFGFAAFYKRGAIIGREPVITGYLLYPIMFPMFFPEFARIGNDSLVLFFAGVLAFCVARGLGHEAEIKWPLAAGVTAGLGLLTKSTFLPVMVALIFFLALRLWVVRKDRRLRPRRMRNLAAFIIPALLLGSGWYIYKLMSVGELTGIGEVVVLASKGGFLSNLAQNFSVGILLQALLVVWVSWVWAGTWSFASLPFLMILPLLFLMAWSGTAYVKSLKKPMTDISWLPLFLFIAIGCGLIYYILMSMALYARGDAIPGYYLHILMPWAAPAFGVGLCAILKKRPRVLKALLFYAVFYQLAAIWSEISLYTGCAIKGDNKGYVFSGADFCLDRVSVVADRLSIIAWPDIAAFGFGAGLLCVLSLYVLQRRRRI